MTSLSRLLFVEGILGSVSGYLASGDLSSRPYAWLRPEFVRPSQFLVVKDSQTPSSRILVEPHLIDAEFRKAWMLFSVGLVILSSLLISSWILLDISCLKSLIWIFRGLRDGTCRR